MTSLVLLVTIQNIWQYHIKYYVLKFLSTVAEHFPNKFVKLAISCSSNVSSQSDIVSNVELSKPHKICVCYRIMSIGIENSDSSGCGLVCFPE